MKTCPYCAEEIQDEAVKCRFCGEWFTRPESKSREIIELVESAHFKTAASVYELSANDLVARAASSRAPLIASADSRTIRTRNGADRNGEQTRLTGVRGWLLFLCINLTFLTPLRILAQVAENSDATVGSLPLEILEAFQRDEFIHVLFALLSFIAGIALWSESKRGVYFATALFVSYITHSTVGIIFNYGDFLLVHSDALIAESIGPVTSSLLWLAYLARSRRVQQTYFEDAYGGSPSQLQTPMSPLRIFVAFVIAIDFIILFLFLKLSS